jgi:zinc finger protein CreA/MIG
LKLKSAPPKDLPVREGDEDEDEDMLGSSDEGTFIEQKKTRKVELPGFKEFEAATRTW